MRQLRANPVTRYAAALASRAAIPEIANRGPDREIPQYIAVLEVTRRSLTRLKSLAGWFVKIGVSFPIA